MAVHARASRQIGVHVKLGWDAGCAGAYRNVAVVSISNFCTTYQRIGSLVSIWDSCAQIHTTHGSLDVMMVLG